MIRKLTWLVNFPVYDEVCMRVADRIPPLHLYIG